MKEEDVLKFLAAGTHLGGTNLDFQMDQYVYKRKSDGQSKKLLLTLDPFKMSKFSNVCFLALP